MTSIKFTTTVIHALCAAIDDNCKELAETKNINYYYSYDSRESAVDSMYLFKFCTYFPFHKLHVKELW